MGKRDAAKEHKRSELRLLSRFRDEYQSRGGGSASDHSMAKAKEPGGNRKTGNSNVPTILIERTLRSGQSLKYSGNVVVMGDVHSGAEIIAAGHILVLGTLRGLVHAGAAGDSSVFVAALRLQPTQLRIADQITRSPDNESFTPTQPEIAFIRDGEVVIERYQPGKAGRLV